MKIYLFTKKKEVEEIVKYFSENIFRDDIDNLYADIDEYMKKNVHEFELPKGYDYGGLDSVLRFWTNDLVSDYNKIYHLYYKERNRYDFTYIWIPPTNFASIPYFNFYRKPSEFFYCSFIVMFVFTFNFHINIFIY